MITNGRVFNDSHIPQRLLHRDQAVRQLSREFRPIVDGDVGGDALISGPSGVGKTVLARHTLEQLERNADVDHTHLRCLGMTEPDILAALLEAAPDGPDLVDRDRFISAEDLRGRLGNVFNDPFVAILDEADAISHTDAIGHLATIPTLSLVVICHEPTDWLSQVAQEHRRRFDGEHHLRLERYGVDELVDILSIRVDHGLRPGVIDREQLRWIADEVAGVARDGIQTVHAAAEIATEREHDIVQDVDVEAAFPRARRRIRKQNLLSMPFHHHLLYALIHEGDEISATELHEGYEEIADSCYHGRALEPIGRRSRRNKLQKLAEYGLVEWSGEHRHRRYRTVDDTVAPTIELSAVTFAR